MVGERSEAHRVVSMVMGFTALIPPLRIREATMGKPKALRRAHPKGTRFFVYAKLTDREDGSEFVHTNHAWDVEVLGTPDD
jgi:hypothetical protein